MNLIAELFGGRAWAQAVWSLVHSLWQAAAIAGAVALVLGRLPARRVRARHAAALAGFALAALAPLATFAVLEARHDLRAGDAWASAGDTPPAPPAPAAGAARADGAPAAERAAPAGPRDAGGSGRSAPAPAGPAWTPFAAAAWLAGATAMLLRTGLGLVSARRLLASPPLPPEHAAALGVEELSARLGLRSWPGRVRVAVTDRVAAPAVAGILHPMILLPPAQLAALGDAQLRAVLAHELAHVVRGDLIVGLAQRVVEACLFFNPAVLWLGARLRAEREACCDAMAAEATGGSRGVAETLARSALAARGGAGWTPALGLASGGRGALRERVARLLAPEARFPAHVPWPTFAAFVLASVVAIAGLGAGAAAVGQAAAGLLDPERHVARAAEIRREFGQRTGLAVDAPEQRVRVSGRVRTADGAPLPADVRLMGSVRTPGRDVGVGAEIGADGSFSAAWPWGRIDLTVVADGYAPAAAEGLAPEPGGAIEGLELVLERGFSMTVRLVDPGGNPVPGAEVAKSQVFAGFHVGERTATTDDRGTTAFEHLGAAPVDLTIRAPGFERERLRIEPVPGGVAEATLTPSIPLRARLVEAGSGRPLAGADVRLAYDSGEPVRMFDPRRGFEEPPLVGTTDADGRLEADGRRGARERVDLGAPAMTVRLREGLRASGVVIDAETGRPIPNARLRLHPIGQAPGPAFDGPVLVTTDAGGRFRVGSLEPRRYAVHADGLVHAGAAYVPDGAGSWRIAPDAPRPDGPQTIGPGDEDRRLVFSIPPWSDLRPLPAGDAE